ncbi:hypothetical protein HZH68_013701 [Vespula germanica]|uniref:Uncharacterized protein n=1 Tax=Vespula germanica TaxID=30212 RepID=A0A834JCR3_VESGE|nr:hypothetical protein HZH68_013701 [Vespula germanica]
MSSSKSTNEPPPTRPPRKPRYDARRFEIEEKSPSISNRWTTSESSIDDRAIKVVTAQIERQPNELPPNLLRSVLLLRDADLTSDELELKMMSPNDKHDYTEKTLTRKTLSMVTSDETETFYLDIPPTSLPRKDRSMDRSTIQIDPTIDTSTSTKIYRPTQHPKDFDNGQIVLQKYFLFFNKSDRSLHTTNLSTTDYADLGGEEYLTKKERRKTLSKLFQCHK